MEKFPAIPASISYRQLQDYAQSAAPESAAIAGPSELDGQAASLEVALEAWRRSSQQLLQLLQQAGPALARGRHPQQLMALGALQAHVAMGLQALASSRRSQD